MWGAEESRVGINLLKDEPSDHIPWTNTMLGFVCLEFMFKLLPGTD